jgi:ATP-dependent helicase HepA
VAGSAQEVLLRWVHEGLDAFRGVLADGRELLRSFGAELLQLAEQDSDAREPALTELIARSREKHAELPVIQAQLRVLSGARRHNQTACMVGGVASQV